MEEEITTVFCLCDELLKATGIQEDPQVKMNNAEVMTVALSASLFLFATISGSAAVKSIKARNTGVTFQAGDVTSMVLEFISSSLRRENLLSLC